MKYPIISKADFCKYINLIKKMDEKEDKLTDAFRELDENADVVMIGLYSSERFAIMDILNTVMDAPIDELIGSDIEYFCWELDYGERYTEGAVTDADGNDIDMGTPEALYDYLVEDYFKRHPEERK